MHDLGKIEVTTKLISKAVDTIEASPEKLGPYSFQGTDLIHSLGSVLRGAIPIMLNQDSALPSTLEPGTAAVDVPLGAKVIRAVRSFDALTSNCVGGKKMTSQEAIRELRKDRAADHDPAVLDALEHVVEVASILNDEPAFV
jgi:response regulator RpfG family c-di-GMP phosphodiesterase